MATKQQINDFIKQVSRAMPLNMGDLFPSVLIAQACLESAYGTSNLAKVANNYFGIKAIGGWTGETYNGYRKYNSLKESIKDRNKFLKENPRYTKAGVFSASTPEQQVDAIATAGYAEASNYANTLKSLISQYDLKKYDTKKKMIIPIVIIGIITGIILFKKYGKKSK